MFAKIFESESEKAEPELLIYFQPKNLGVSSIAVAFSDTDEGWEKRDQEFNKLNLEEMNATVSALYETAGLA